MKKDIENKIEKVKWQIHAETSASSILMCIILWKLFGGWFGIVCSLVILGNLMTLTKSVSHLGKNYFIN
jgi:hypothetical protein